MKKYIVSIGSCLLFLACTKNADTSKKDTSPVMNIGISPKVSENTSDFAFNFFLALQKERPDTGNIFVSPLSLHMDMGMLLNGAAGNTYTQLQNALALNGLSIDEINKAYQTLLQDLPNADKQVQLDLANSMWYNNDFSVLPSYTGILKNYFQSSAYASLFGTGAVDSINRWASDNTYGKINHIIDNIDGYEVMFLLNALYFKGQWASQFDKKATKLQTFTLENGNTKQIEMMSQENAFAYQSKVTYSAIRLPYGNGQFSMTILLPAKGNKIEEVMNGFTVSDWNSFQQDTSKVKVNVELPRFQISLDSTDLIPVLKTMGATDLFNPDLSDLSKINADAKLRRLYVNILKQFTYLKVDEVGTEAAAVTIGGIAGTSVEMPPPFICDHPFGIIISENTSNTILFMGRIMNPLSD